MANAKWEVVGVLSLAELCLGSVANIAHSLDPVTFVEVPKSLVVQIAESLHPLDLEKFENSQIFQRLGIDTEPLWESLYMNKWSYKKLNPHDWCPVSELSKRTMEVVWREQYWYQLFSQVLGEAACVNSNQCDNWIWQRCLSKSHQKGRFALQPRDLSLEDFITLNRKYAKCLQLDQRIVCFLVKHENIFALISDYVEYLKLNSLRRNAFHNLYKLLQNLLAKNLRSVGMYFFKYDQSSDLHWSQCLSITKQQQSGFDLTSVAKYDSSYSTGSSNTRLRSYEHCKPENVVQNFTQYNQLIQDLPKVSNAGTGNVDSITSRGFNGCNQTHGTSERLNTDHTGVKQILELSDSVQEKEIDIYNFLPNEDNETNELQHESASSSAGSQLGAASTLDNSLYDEVFTGRKQTPYLTQLPASLDMQALLNQSLVFCPLRHFVLVTQDLDFEVEVITKTLRKFTNLESLAINEVPIPYNLQWKKEKLYQQFASSVVENVCSGSLRNLSFTINSIDISGFVHVLSDVLRSNCVKCRSNFRLLQSLQLSWAYRTSQDISRVLQKLAESLSNQCLCSNSHDSDSESSARSSEDKQPCSSTVLTANLHTADKYYGLQELVIDGITCWENFERRNGNADAMAVAGVLSQNSTLVFLQLSSCDFTTEGISAIFHSIAGTHGYRGNRTLRILNLSHNLYEPDKDDGLEMLLLHSVLTELDLGHCRLKMLPEDVIEALCHNTTLRSLCLAENKLGDSGVVALAKVFKSETQKLPLKKLCLSANRINKIASIKVLSSALRQWLPQRLEEIDLRENLLSISATRLNGREEREERTCDTVLSLLKPLVKHVIADRSTGSYIPPDFADYVAEM